jgi:riboflavin synthase
MFTGLVTAVGRIASASTGRDGGRDLTIEAPYRGLQLGESIAIDGVCLTVVHRSRGRFAVRAIATTLARTTFGDRRAGDRVNLERALRVGDRLGGHLVQGHVDGVGRVVATRPRHDAWLVDVAVPKEVAAVSVPLGSITIDGVSLTVNQLPKAGIVQVSLIPHTRAHTTLGTLRVGRRVHLEADMIGKYLAALTSAHRGKKRRAG